MGIGANRLLREYRQLRRERIPGVVDLHPISERNMYEWIALLEGPSETPYEGGTWILLLSIPKSYPIEPPSIRFCNKIIHPNICWKTGKVCIDILQTGWTPAWNLQSACLAVLSLLDNAETTSPLNADAAKLLRTGDRIAYNSLVQCMTHLHAGENITQDYIHAKFSMYQH
ncbi:ubiquitin conjugating enzyme Ubc16 [Schizosaccharomyces japonicus yFS275]|uniref:Ubiquitin conjugating enzyme Ubc16 n=1 Tax=Schizosaccharomyces japonicus (strain yFS275 / FY16936) TaxID=402676 RepID=B6K7Y4_SCHJY|nr:ubiquitin conjugating enzyme Ubc16 [Schizosaccharomyces japonicus yFS275]EEB09638.1 ubiquitin conjugating enzyme Ubc16 [Schizosaccharomyces japonicus yFS275]